MVVVITSSPTCHHQQVDMHTRQMDILPQLVDMVLPRADIPPQPADMDLQTMDTQRPLEVTGLLTMDTQHPLVDTDLPIIHPQLEVMDLLATQPPPAPGNTQVQLGDTCTEQRQTNVH